MVNMDRVDRIINLIKRRDDSGQGILGNTLLLEVLIEHALNTHALSTIMDALSTSEIGDIYSLLSRYPTTEIGWGLLPKSRKHLLESRFSPDEISNLSQEVLADVNLMDSQKEREAVVVLRKVLFEKINEIQFGKQ